jgi:hypothetical protein
MQASLILATLPSAAFLLRVRLFMASRVSCLGVASHSVEKVHTQRTSGRFFRSLALQCTDFRVDLTVGFGFFHTTLVRRYRGYQLMKLDLHPAAEKCYLAWYNAILA